jgi:hypothetical protein
METQTMIRPKYRCRYVVLDSGNVTQIFDEGFQIEHDLWKASPIFAIYWVLEDDHGKIWLCSDSVAETATAFVSFREKREFASTEAALMAARMKKD